MTSSVYFFVLVVLCLNFTSSKKSFPPYITLCHRNDPKLIECLRKNAEEIRPHLAKGVPEFMIPPLEPLVILSASLNAAGNFNASFKDIQTEYTSDFILDDLVFDFDTLHAEIAVTFPRVRLRSHYQVEGKILVLQLKGSGRADGNFTSVTARVFIDGKRYVKNGKEYADFHFNKIDMNLGKPVFYFENIFGDNQELNDQTNKVLNENVVELLVELRPIIDQVVNEIVLGIVSPIFKKYSLDELFPK